jgi:hypothetical protein
LWLLIYSIGNFLSISLQERIGLRLRNVLIWLHQMNSFSLMMDLFAGAELVSAYSLTFWMSGNHMSLGSHATVFQSEVYAILECSEYCISEGIVNRAISICSDGKAAFLALKSYAVSSRVVLQCGDSLRELVLTEFDWCGSLDTVVSMEMRRSTHLQEQDQALLLWGRSLVFRWYLRVWSEAITGPKLNSKNFNLKKMRII